MNPQDIKTTVKTFILNEYLPGEDPAALTDTTPLMTTGILDSIAVLKVVTFLEDQFGITHRATRGRSREPQYIVGYRAICDVKESLICRSAQAACRSFVH